MYSIEDEYMYMVKINGEKIADIPEQYITPELVRAAIITTPSALHCVPPQYHTRENILLAVRGDYQALTAVRDINHNYVSVLMFTLLSRDDLWNEIARMSDA